MLQPYPDPLTASLTVRKRKQTPLLYPCRDAFKNAISLGKNKKTQNKTTKNKTTNKKLKKKNKGKKEGIKICLQNKITRGQGRLSRAASSLVQLLKSLHSVTPPLGSQGQKQRKKGSSSSPADLAVSGVSVEFSPSIQHFANRSLEEGVSVLQGWSVTLFPKRTDPQ